MSRSGYTDADDIDHWELIKWRGQVASSTRGKRGQALLRDLITQLDAMPEKRLITNDLETKDGDVCALGAVGQKRGVNMDGVDPYDAEQVASLFDIAEPLAKEIVYMNDEYFDRQSPEERWKAMRAWAEKQLNKEQP